MTSTTPHLPDMPPTVVRYHYNEANSIEAIDANLRGATGNGQPDGEPVWTPFVTNTDYDARGRRTRIDHGNGTTSTYAYDRLTSRLAHLITRRGAELLQDLSYTYDAAGNLTRITDGAQQRVFFANQVADPNCDYTYDALYRLIEATGREHLGQAGPIPHGSDDYLRSRLPHPGDGGAIARYVERYTYDAAGNLRSMQHSNANPALPGWTREYHFAEPSQLQDDLPAVAVGRDQQLGHRHPDHWRGKPAGRALPVRPPRQRRPDAPSRQRRPRGQPGLGPP